MSGMREGTKELLNKQMDRKEFIKHVGVAAAIIVGIPAVLKALSQIGGQSGSPVSSNNDVKSTANNRQNAHSSYSYGASAYGV